MVGVVIAVLGVGYTIFIYYYRGKGHCNIKAKVSPPEDTKGLSSVVPEQRHFVDQKRMSQTEAEKETDSLHDHAEGQTNPNPNPNL